MNKVANKLKKKVLAKRKAQAEDKERLEAGGGYSPEPTDEDKNPPEVVTESPPDSAEDGAQSTK